MRGASARALYDERVLDHVMLADVCSLAFA